MQVMKETSLGFDPLLEKALKEDFLEKMNHMVP